MFFCYVSYYYTPYLFAGNQSNHQNFEKSLLSYKCWLIFIGMKEKKKKIEKKKNLNGRLKRKSHFPAPPILNIFSWKFHGLVLGLVELNDVKGISVAQLMRLSDKYSKTGKKSVKIYRIRRIFPNFDDYSDFQQKARGCNNTRHTI